METSDPIVLSPRGCNPWPENQELFPNLPICVDFDLSANSDAVCAFMYEENDEDCGGLDARNYKLQSFASQAAAEAAGGVVTHDGGRFPCQQRSALLRQNILILFAFVT